MSAAEIACRVMATLWVLLVIFSMNSRHGEKHGAHNRLSRPINVRQQGAIKLNTNQTKHVFKLHTVCWIVLLVIASSYNCDEYLHKSFAFRPGSNGHCFFYN
jgi:hypothetical protein